MEKRRTCSPTGAPPGAATLLENLSTAVICTDAGLQICWLNPAAQVLFGIGARQSLGLALTTAIPALAEQGPRLRRAVAAGAAFTVHELHLGYQSEERTVDCTVTPLVGRERPGLLLEFASLDRQLRIARDERLRSQNLANREMLRGLAHEIKNPLGGLRGAAQLLEGEVSDPDLRDYTAIIIREADRLQNLVDGMLGPRQPPRLVRLNIHEPLEHVRLLLAAELPQGVALVRDYDPSIPELAGDREQLIQVFFNLLGNAAQAVGAGGEIRLRTRTQRLATLAGRQHRLVVRVDIADDGPGIADEMLARVFLPMVSARAGGSGMGLPIAQYLTHLHGGLIECESRPGATVFTVVLPLEDGQDG